MTDTSPDEYGDAIGFVMLARRRYEDLCETDGPDSAAAVSAHDELARGLKRRDEMRRRHDARPDHPQRRPSSR